KALTCRGVNLSGVVLASMLSQNVASACLPASIVSSTIKTARLVAASKGAVAGVVSANVAALIEGVMKTMLLTKLKVVLALVLVLGFITTGATVLALHSATAQDKRPISKEQVKSPPKQIGRAHV